VASPKIAYNAYVVPQRARQGVETVMHIPHASGTLFACLILLSGCGPLVIRDDERNAYVPIQTGTFELHKDVTIRAGRTRAYLQDGAIVPGVNEFRPHCQLDVNTLQDVPRTIKPDQFNITRISMRTDEIVQASPLRLAALGDIGLAASDAFDGGLTRRMYVYLFFLHSDRQPDVRVLICGGAFDDPIDAKLPTLGEIARVLGENGTLTLR
jgi:hypothetical protein